MSESRLGAQWRMLAGEGRAGLVPYLTAGYPSPAGSLELLRIADRYADVIEVGVPFSDPLADGPTIQRASFEALRQGMTLAGTLRLIDQAAPQAPVVLFSYLNPLLRYGLSRFLADAAAVGVAGVLLTDLPAGSDPARERELLDSPLDLIRLVAPTTTPQRLARAVSDAQGFVYLVARLGVTGASSSLAEDLAASIARVRAATTVPIAVGFGLATPEQVAAVGRLADGVVVGSALVDRVGREGVAGAEALLASLRAALEPMANAGGRA